MSSKRGAATKLTPKVCATIVKCLKGGAFKRHAAEAAGIDEHTLNDWLVRGAAGEKGYVAFAREVQRVQAEDAVRNQAIITKAAVSDWKAAAWSLERKHPKLYGRGAAPQLGMTIGPSSNDPDDDSPVRTRIEFYLPDNGRRPDIITDDEEEA